VLSALLLHLLETRKVGRIVQTAASIDRPVGNETVTSRTPAEILAAAGSRYAPSAPLQQLEAALREPGQAAFVGKPCDVAALRALARCDPRIDATFPYMISFFCAGVPSLAGATKILERLDVAETEVAAFRYRGNGWPGKATATMRDGRELAMSYAESWGGILSRHVQFRCKICPDGTGNFADIACADAWHCDERGYPRFEEADGVSLVLSRTAKGEALVKEIHAAGLIAAKRIAPVEIDAMQPGHRDRKRLILARLAALATLFRPTPRFTGFDLAAAARQARPRALLHNFLGTLRRLSVMRSPG
jgi:coenzyme F420 hydrogenase subunit beta